MVGMSRYHRIAAGKVFAGDRDAVEVRISGKTYARSDALIDYYRDRTEPKPSDSKLIRRLDATVAKLAARAESLKRELAQAESAEPPRKGFIAWAKRKLDWVEAKLSETERGRKFVGWMKKAAVRFTEWTLGPVERVATDVKAEVTSRTGEKDTRIVTAEDNKLRLIFERLSQILLLPMALPGVPFVGLVVPPVSAALLSLFGLGVFLMGDLAATETLLRMTRKHGSMITANLAPVIGCLLPIAAIVADGAEIDAVTQPATVGDVMRLKEYAEREQR